MTLRAMPSSINPEFIKFEFADNGIGMITETLNRIFDPFFTTRMGKGGSGFGMSIVHNTGL